MQTKLIIMDGAVVGTTTPDDPNGYMLVPAPEGFDGDLSAVVFDAQAGVARLSLAGVQAQRVAAIKQEAAALIAATDWRLQRAREREQAGWMHVADVAAVLAEREAIRRSSNAAEAAVLQLTDPAAVQAFTWAPTDVAVLAPRLLTHEQLIQRFTDAEWQTMTEAARGNAAMDAWMRRFTLASVINLDDPATQAGVQALEIAGILAPGRAAEILGEHA
ncbi:hypothetical protein [Alicycliphilus denitrificans]|uniref:hypothetical protein n=1 Tax=Alicycliphilus denitrificans TaxID=179636 RepID=UPI0001D9FEA8|nr:hypothetical protein [Alicycliphilus denitrificans]ADU99025.1 hypothetical protein Alide_1264 [Alicycliphilus denitrificans BC]